MSGFYDKPDVYTYTFPAHDFGTGSNITQVIAVPLDASSVGKRGRVQGVTIKRVTEDFVGTTTGGGVQVGDGSDADKYYDSGTVLGATVDVAESVFLVDDGAQVDIEGGRTSITVTCVATVGGSITGIADVDIHIGWY